MPQSVLSPWNRAIILNLLELRPDQAGEVSEPHLSYASLFTPEIGPVTPEELFPPLSAVPLCLQVPGPWRWRPVTCVSIPGPGSAWSPFLLSPFLLRGLLPCLLARALPTPLQDTASCNRGPLPDCRSENWLHEASTPGTQHLMCS